MATSAEIDASKERGIVLRGTRMRGYKHGTRTNENPHFLCEVIEDSAQRCVRGQAAFRCRGREEFDTMDIMKSEAFPVFFSVSCADI